MKLREFERRVGIGRQRSGIGEENWSREVGHRVDIDFSEEPRINVSTRNLKSCLDYFELFIT